MMSTGPFIISEYFEILEEVTTLLQGKYGTCTKPAFFWMPAELGLLERQVLLQLSYQWTR
jgi:hypothetical protein